jgi:hypothetical protein
MSVPLRKDEFDDEELTTADLAQSKRPVAGEERGPLLAENRANPVPVPRTIERTAAAAPEIRDTADSTSLVPHSEMEEMRNRWNDIQTAFVDEPRRAVEQADGLVASAMKRLAEVFSEERSKLEQQWDRGDDVSTEDLRIALQRYRSFFHRLLSI